MIRQLKNNQFSVVCSVCKNEAGTPLMSTEEDALEQIKLLAWFIVGKFHICPHCFDNALEQWKIDNKELLNDVQP